MAEAKEPAVNGTGGDDQLCIGVGNDVFADGAGEDKMWGDASNTPIGMEGDDYLKDSNGLAHPDTICLTKKPCSAITIQHYLLVGFLREVEDLHWRQAA